MVNPDDYILHMVSLRLKGENGFSVAFGDGRNLQPWHLDVIEKWLAEQRTKQVSVLLHESNKAMEDTPWRDDLDGSDLV